MKMSLMTHYFSMFLSGLISLSLNRKHLMTSLLSLEMMILGLFCSFSFMLLYMYMYMDMYMLLIFLTFSVCEGVMGLSCLVVLIRSHSYDYLLSMSLSTC